MILTALILYLYLSGQMGVHTALTYALICILLGDVMGYFLNLAKKKR